MSRDEFLYEHDVVGISEMLKQVIGNDEEEQNISEEEILAVDFL
jgi:hypothetical protein